MIEQTKRRLTRRGVSLVAVTPTRMLGILVTAILLLAGTAATASAATYCVGAAPNCTGTAEANLDAALTKADADTTGSDTIVLSAGTQTDATGFEYDGHVPLEIDGQGPNSTILTVSTTSNTTVLTVPGNVSAPLTLNELALQIPANTDADTGFEGQSATTINHVAVTSTGANGVTTGIYLGDGGSVSSSTVTLPTSAAVQNLGIYISGSGTVQDSSVTGVTGIESTTSSSGPGALVIHRSVITGTSGGGEALLVQYGTAQIDDSVVEAYQGAIGLYDYQAASVTARQLTIVGDDQSSGVLVSNYSAQDVPLRLSDSIVANSLARPFVLNQFGSGLASIATDHDDYDHSSLPTGFNPGTGDLSTYVAPVFADASNGDFRLLASSPSTLFGEDTSTKDPGESITDLDGLPRFNGAARDLGAYQHQLPTASASTGSPTATLGAAASFTASGSTDEPNDPLTYRWSFDDGQTATGPAVSHAFTTAGSHMATVTVTDALGFSATATASVTVASPKVTVPLPSNAFTLKSSAVTKTGAVTLQVHTYASGTATVTTTFTETIRTKVGKGKHRKTKFIQRRVTYARTVTIKVGSTKATSFKLSPTAAAKAHLRGAKHEQVTVTTIFTPTGGQAATHKLTISV